MAAVMRVLPLLMVAVAIGNVRAGDDEARLLERANAAFAGQRPLDAVRLYREYLARYVDRPDVRVFLGGALLNAGKPDEALAECRRALSLDKSYGRPYTVEGRIYAGHREWEAAQRAFRNRSG